MRPSDMMLLPIRRGEEHSRHLGVKGVGRDASENNRRSRNRLRTGVGELTQRDGLETVL